LFGLSRVRICQTFTYINPCKYPLQAFGKSFWWTSLVAAIATVSALIGLYEWQGARLLIAAETRSDIQTVRTLGNILWPNYSSFLVEASGLSKDELNSRPEQSAIYGEILSATRDLPILKVKLFSALTGQVLFSTESKQIGDLGHATMALEVARSGKEMSEITFRKSFNGIRGVLQDRHVVATYAPYYPNGLSESGTSPSIVVEIYSDVTDRVQSHRNSKIAIVSGVLLTISLVYFGVFLMGRKASRALAKASHLRQQQEEKLMHQAFHDALTGLPNRAGLKKFLINIQNRVEPLPLAIFCIDVDRFKSINSSLGHTVGDQVLQQLANRLQATVSDGENVFRNGSNEFLVICNFNDVGSLTIQSEKLANSLHEKLCIDGTELNVTVSIGVARWPQDQAKLEQVIRCADLAKSYAKTEQQAAVEFYRPEMRKAHDEQILMMSGLQKALLSDEFVLHYQPRLGSNSRKIESVEALIRWQHPTLGLLPPARFIEALEDSPLIIEVGNWVLETACRQTMRWHLMGYTDLKVSVNVAARQFRQTNFIESVLIALERTGLSPHFLELELTEGQLMSNLESASKTLSALREIGVSVSIDDFGTGYSSLSYLHQLPIDCLKIDRSFVMSITEDRRRSSIAKTITMLGHNLEMTVVAEGVETKEQADLLTSWGCTQLQGYYFSKPVDHHSMSQLLQLQRSTQTNKTMYQETIVHRTDSGVKVEIAYSD
jgi:diguanylate cyclase (GGDEF)-like protein